MLKNILILSFVVCIFPVKGNENPTIISLDYVSLYGTYAVPITISFSSKLFLTGTRRLDLKNQFLLFSFHNLPPNSLNNISNISIFLNERNIECQIITSTIKISNIPFNCTFYNNNDENFRYHLSYQNIPLAFSFQDDNFSLIHKLLSEGVIHNSIFSIEPLSDRGGKFHIGGLPNQSVLNKKYKSIIKIDKKHQTWGSNLQEVRIGRKTIWNKNNYVYFQFNISEIYVSLEFLEILNKTILYSFINSKKCWYEYRYYKKYYECFCQTFLTFPNISFVINGTNFNLQLKEMRDKISLKKEDNCSLTIMNVESEMTDGHWIFGTTLMGNYIRVFDYEKKTIFFYSNKPFSVLNDNQIFHIIYLFIIFSLIIQIVLFVYIKNYILKKYKKELIEENYYMFQNN